MVRWSKVFVGAAISFVVGGCGAESPTGGTGAPPSVVRGHLLSVFGDGQVGNLRQPLADSLIVKVADPSGNGLPGVTVRWSANDGIRPSKVSPTTVVTDSEGFAKGQWTLGTTTGGQTATEQTASAFASVSGVGSLTFTATTPSLVPLTDMGATPYFDFPGGLYPGGNVMPQAHAVAGRAFAAAVEPLDFDGNPQPGGKHVLLSIGASNTVLIFCGDNPCPSFSFTGQAMADADVDRMNLTIVNGADGGNSAEFWESPDLPIYEDIRIFDLERMVLSEQQVQAVWLYVGDNVPPPSPHDPGANASGLVTQLGNIMRALKSRYPNLRLAFLSSRVYGGHTKGLDRIKEPYSYEHGFAMKWLVQAQIDQMASGGTIVDGRAGDLNYNTVAPWIAWGPYLWADGFNSRSDGLLWSAEDYSSFDGIHLSESGRTKAADLLLGFFKTSPHARCWFVAGEKC